VNHRPRHLTVERLEAGLRWPFAEVYGADQFLHRKRRYLEIVKRL
jgi:hypothetical protein